jgi:hypothetical protein
MMLLFNGGDFVTRTHYKVWLSKERGHTEEAAALSFLHNSVQSVLPKFQIGAVKHK